MHRALASSPVWTPADHLNLGLGWTDSPWLNKDLVIAGVVAVVAAAIIARPAHGSQEPDRPIDPEIA